MLESRRHLDLATEAVDVEPGTELRRQDLDDDIAAERDFTHDEDARHSAAEILGDLIAIAERALETSSQIPQILIQEQLSAGKECWKIACRGRCAEDQHNFDRGPRTNGMSTEVRGPTAL